GFSNGAYLFAAANTARTFALRADAKRMTGGLVAGWGPLPTTATWEGGTKLARGDTAGISKSGRGPTTVVMPPVVVQPPTAAKRIVIDMGGGVKLELVRIEPGRFTMGSPRTEEGRKPDETEHAVEITKPYYLGTFEVTQEQYTWLTGKNPSYFS